MPRPQLDAFEHRILTCIDFRFLSSPLYEQASPLFPTLTSPGAAFELKGPLFIPWQRRDRLALHRLNERRFCALSNCLVLLSFSPFARYFSARRPGKARLTHPARIFRGNSTNNIYANSQNRPQKRSLNETRSARRYASEDCRVEAASTERSDQKDMGLHQEEQTSGREEKDAHQC